MIRMNNYILVLIGGIAILIGMLDMFFSLGSVEFNVMGKICSNILMAGIILSVLGALNSLNETEKEKTNKKVENISTKIIETEKTNE